MSTRLGHQSFSRTTASLAGGAGESAPTNSTGAWNIDEVVELSIAVKKPTGNHTSFDLVLYGSFDGTNWFIINNGTFSEQTNFLESFQVSPLMYIKPIISITAGSDSYEYTITGRGSRKRG
jgi:hypothetical protein